MNDDPDRVDEIAALWGRERPDLDVSPVQVIGRLHRLGAALTEQLVTLYARYGLSEGEFDVLATLRRGGGPCALRPAELARLTMVTTGGITKRLDRLEAAGLVVRSPDGGGDARAKLAVLTERGRALIDEAFAAHVANEHRLLAPVPEPDREELRRILKSWHQGIASMEASR